MGPQGHPYSPYGSGGGGLTGAGASGLTGLHHSHHHPLGVGSGVSATPASGNNVGPIPLPVSLSGSTSFAHPHAGTHPHPLPYGLGRKPLDFLSRLPAAGGGCNLPVAMASLPAMAGMPSGGYLPSVAASPFFGAGLHGYRSSAMALPSLYNPTAAAAAAHSFQTLLASLSAQRPKMTGAADAITANDYQSLLSSLSTLQQQNAAAAAAASLPSLHSIAALQVRPRAQFNCNSISCQSITFQLDLNTVESI